MIRVVESTQTEIFLEILKDVQDNGEISSFDELRDEIARMRKNYNYERDFDRFNALSDIFMYEKEANGNFSKALELCIQQKEKQAEQEREYSEKSKKELQDLNNRLKNCKTKEDFEELYNFMENKGYIFYVKTKSGGKENGIWAYDDGTVEYITDRDSRVRKCRISNLWKSLYIGI